MTFSLNQQSNRTSKTYSYLRVSQASQDLEKNKFEILALANAKLLGNVQFVEEIISGKVPWRKRKIAEILEEAQKGDALIVSELSRLGRSMLEIMEILSVATQKGLSVYSVKGSWELNDSIQSKLIAMCFSMASEIERDLISKRTIEALQARKLSGMKLGRPKGIGKSKLDQYRPEIEALLANGSSQKFISGRYNTTPANLNLWLKKHEIKKSQVFISRSEKVSSGI
ncbi:MAG: recombinase family protein [Candidatus Levyibacteriota bacterium]